MTSFKIFFNTTTNPINFIALHDLGHLLESEVYKASKKFIGIKNL